MVLPLTLRGAVAVVPAVGRPHSQSAAALLIVSAVPLLVTHHVFQDNRWGRGIPWSYTGPISLVEQRFRATHDNLRRIDVWA